MGRVTRKMAAEVAEALHIDEDDVLAAGIENIPNNTKELGLVEQQLDRAPLGEIEPNSAESQSDTSELKKSIRGGRKGTRKGAKGKKNDLGASTAILREEEASHDHQPEVLPDANDRTPSPASEQAAEDLIKDASGTRESRRSVFDTFINISSNVFHGANAGVSPVAVSIPMEHPGSNNTKSATRAVKVTRSRCAKQLHDTPVEPKSLIDGIGQFPEEKESMKEEYNGAVGIPDIVMHEEQVTTDGDAGALPIDAPASPLPNAVPKPLAHLRADTPAKRSASNKENIEPSDIESPSTPQPTQYDALEQAVVAAATPQAAATEQLQQHEDPIVALDNLDEAVESVNKDIPDVQSSPEKPRNRKESVERKTTKKPAPVVRATKASQARISLSQNPDVSTKAPTLGRPRPSMALGRSTSVRQSESPGKRVASNTSITKSPTDGEKKEVIIPHSKPRPMSMSFPAPPQPIKSSKAPTQSTFQLPGEAVAAKLKAAREARMQKEAEEKKTTFKARPVPSSLSKAPSVRQTTASKARESIITGRDLKTSVNNTSASNSAHKRAQSVATSQPSLSTTKPRVISTGTTRPSTLSTSTIIRPAINSATTTLKARPTTALSNTSKPRSSLFSSSTASARPNTTTAPAAAASNGTIKGREVFNRPAAAKAAAEKERLEKEAAAKKARAEAAERGRQASREWAEKQKRIAAAKKAAANGQEHAGVAAVETIPEAQAVEAS